MTHDPGAEGGPLSDDQGPSLKGWSGCHRAPRFNLAYGAENVGGRVGTEKSSGRGSVWTPQSP